MDKLKIWASGAIAGILAMIAPAVHAQTPPAIEMDSTVQAGMLSIITGLKDTIFSLFTTVAPYAGVVLVTVFGAFLLLRLFRRIAHV